MQIRSREFPCLQSVVWSGCGAFHIRSLASGTRTRDHNGIECKTPAHAMTRLDVLPSALCTVSAPRTGLFRGSMAGLCAPPSTLRPGPRGQLRMTRGRCGSLLLHRKGLTPSNSLPVSRRFALNVRFARKQTFDQPPRFREHRIRSEMARRRTIASDYRPCFSAFLLRCAGRSPAVHPASAFLHRGRLAHGPAPRLNVWAAGPVGDAAWLRP